MKINRLLTYKLTHETVKTSKVNQKNVVKLTPIKMVNNRLKRLSSKDVLVNLSSKIIEYFTGRLIIHSSRLLTSLLTSNKEKAVYEML